MAEFSIRELEEWNEKIDALVKESGLSCYEQEFEICSYDDMIGYEAYIGMPAHYPHWSYGKAFEKIRTLHKYNLTGLPYEMVINSNPCLAYLMKDNTLLLQILTISHVYGHNDFFKNNRLFKVGARAEYAVEMFKHHADRIREYIADPSIGYAKVERVLNAAHALKYQVCRVSGEKIIPEELRKKMLLENLHNEHINEYPYLCPTIENKWDVPDFKKVPLEPEEDLLYFIAAFGGLEEWEKDIINIVREESLYFIPQMETKIMNEGWASFWHYNILNKLELPQPLHIEFLKRHNQVIKPHGGSINPYYVGFKILEDIMKRYGVDKIFEVREIERDQSFIRRYLTEELCQEMNLFEYVKLGNEYIVSEVSDENGWKKIVETLAKTSGVGGIPVIRAIEWVQKDNTLLLEHQYDGRELDFTYAYETIKHIVDLWDAKIMLETWFDGKKKIIICDEQKKVTLVTV